MKINVIVIFLGIASFMVSSCGQSDAAGGKNDENREHSELRDAQPEIEFESTSYDFGKIQPGEKVGWFFKFKNTGGSDLVIKHASASCGCTVPDYDRKPIPPGEEGSIKVVFDSEGRSGKQVKTVTIESNARNMITKLKLEAEIVEKE